MSWISCNDIFLSLFTDQTASKLESSAIHPRPDPRTIHKQKKKSFVTPRNMGGVGTTVGLQSLNRVSENKREDNSSKQEQAKRDGEGLIMKQKIRRSHNQAMPTKENGVDAASKTLKVNSFEVIVAWHVSVFSNPILYGNLLLQL